MIHVCKVHCQDVNNDSVSKWLPFIFHMYTVEGAKMTTDDPDHPAYGYTTVFCRGGETYIIDTPYESFFEKFRLFNEDPEIPRDDGPDF